MNYTIEVGNTTKLFNQDGVLVWEFKYGSFHTNLSGAADLITAKAKPNSEEIVFWLLNQYLKYYGFQQWVQGKPQIVPWLTFSSFFRITESTGSEVDRARQRFEFSMAYAKEWLKSNESKRFSLKDIENLEEFAQLINEDPRTVSDIEFCRNKELKAKRKKK
jgi:hypothetical protein